MFCSPVLVLDTIISNAKISRVISVVLSSSNGGRIQLHGEIDKAMTLRISILDSL